MTVLIATPTYGDGPLPETAASIGAQRNGGWEWRQYRANQWPAPDKRNVMAQYEAIRAEFLAGTWEALLTVEHDMVLPPNALGLLLATGAPVAYGVYLLRHGSLVLNAWEYIGERNLGESVSLRRRGIKFDGVMRVSGVGFGCTLMRREVVERFPFHDGGDAGQSPDIPFAKDCIRNGVLQVAHFGVICGHIDEGKVLMPGVDDRGVLVRLHMLQTINALVERQTRRLEAGQEYEVPIDEARELCRAGYGVMVWSGDVPASGDADVRPEANAAGKEPGKPGRAKRH